MTDTVFIKPLDLDSTEPVPSPPRFLDATIAEAIRATGFRVPRRYPNEPLWFDGGELVWGDCPSPGYQEVGRDQAERVFAYIRKERRVAKPAPEPVPTPGAPRTRREILAEIERLEAERNELTERIAVEADALAGAVRDGR